MVTLINKLVEWANAAHKIGLREGVNPKIVNASFWLADILIVIVDFLIPISAYLIIINARLKTWWKRTKHKAMIYSWYVPFTTKYFLTKIKKTYAENKKALRQRYRSSNFYKEFIREADFKLTMIEVQRDLAKYNKGNLVAIPDIHPDTPIPLAIALIQDNTERLARKAAMADEIIRVKEGLDSVPVIPRFGEELDDPMIQAKG